MAIVDRFVNASDPVLANGLVPLLREAVRPYISKFSREVSAADHAAWRPDRLEVVKVIERAVKAHSKSPALLVQLGRILRDRRDDDPDPPVREACEQVLARFPHTFEVRVARFLTLLAHDEFRVEPGADFKAARISAERNWVEFGRRVAKEVIEQFPSPAHVCEFFHRQLRELKETNSTVFVGALLGLIAEISSEWCAGLLEEMFEAEEPTLDAFLQPVIREASVHAAEAYRKVVDVLPTRNRPNQLFGLIHHLGWKHVHGGGITELERKALLQAANRKEAPVICALATVAGVHFNNVPQLALDVLSRLEPTDESEATAVLSSLALLAEGHSTALDRTKIGRILANLGAHSLSEMSGVKHQLARLARLFPRQVYEHLRSLLDAGSDAARLVRTGFQRGVPLGPMDDPDFLRREIDQQWQKLRAEPGPQEARLSLIRSLLRSDAGSAPERLRQMIEQAGTGTELELVTRLAAPQGTKFVFQFPELVRLLLTRGTDLGIGGTVRGTLRHSACGGGRSFPETDLDPENLHILTEAESLANRYRDDHLRTPVAEFLMRQDVAINEPHRGQTGLHWAAYGGHAEIVKLILQRGAAVNLKDERFNSTPLGWALHGWADPPEPADSASYHVIVSALVAAGATVDLKNIPREKLDGHPRMAAALRGELPGN